MAASLTILSESAVLRTNPMRNTMNCSSPVVWPRPYARTNEQHSTRLRNTVFLPNVLHMQNIISTSQTFCMSKPTNPRGTSINYYYQAPHLLVSKIVKL
jgi:hypothetical protein